MATLSDLSMVDDDDIAGRVTDLIVVAADEEVAQLPELPAELTAVVRHLLVLLRGGKRLRARFAYEAWRACGGTGDPEPVLVAAASAELSHAFALVQDDVIDRSAMRRSVDTVHRRAARLHRHARWHGDSSPFGHSVALMLGNWCWGWSHRLLDRAGSDPETVAALKRVAEQMLLDGSYGEALDVVLQSERRFEVEQCRLAAHYKTGVTIFKPPLLMGAILAGASRETLEALAGFGEAVGDAYQLRDDLIGTFGDPRVTGKSDGDDVRDGKPTVMIATALDGASARQRDRLLELYGSPSLDPAGVHQVRALLRETGAVAAVNAAIEECSHRASRLLADARLAPRGRGRLEALAREASHRAR